MTQKNNNESKLTVILWSALGADLLALLVARTFLADMTWLSILLSVVLVAVLGLLIRENRKALTGRTAAFGLNSLITVVLVVGLLGVVNFLAARYPQKVDLTSNKVHTLSDQSRKIVKELKEPVQAVLFANLQQKEQARPLLENYADLSTQLKVEYVDPSKEPIRAKQEGVKRYNTLLLVKGERKLTVDDPDEEKVTNALIKLVKTDRQVLCWVSGHGEKDYNSQEADGYYGAKTELEDQAYEIRPVNLPQEGKIPADCTAIAIIGPTKSFFEPEVKAVSEYLDNGGRAIVALDVDIKGRDPSPELLKLLEGWNVTAKTALIVDPLSRMLGVDAAVPIIATYSKDHSVTKDFQDNSYFPFSRPLETKGTAPAGLNVQWLAKTTPKSWGEMNLAELSKGQVQFNEGSDAAGPLVTAMSVEGKKKDSKAERNTRLVVFGTSQFATNNYSRFGGNLDLFLNSVSWAMQDESMISIRAKEEAAGKVELTQASGTMVFWISVVIVPLLIVVAGTVNWLRRRKL